MLTRNAAGDLEFNALQIRDIRSTDTVLVQFRDSADGPWQDWCRAKAVQVIGLHGRRPPSMQGTNILASNVRYVWWTGGVLTEADLRQITDIEGSR